jgi:phage terminase small subunit
MNKNAQDLTPPVKRFADGYLKDGKKQANALKQWPGLSPEVASVKANRLLKNDKVQMYLNGQALLSAKNMARLANSEKHDSVTLRANQDILNRTGYTGSLDSNQAPVSVYNGDQAKYLEAITEALKAGDTVALERIVLSSN